MSDPFKMETCSKCGMRAVAFICSTPGCPVNGGAAYGPAPPRSEPFDAAVRAAHALMFRGPNPESVQMRDIVKAALHAALPPDPAPETIEAMWDAMGRVGLSRSAVVASYHALRTSLLPGEEP